MGPNESVWFEMNQGRLRNGTVLTIQSLAGSLVLQTPNGTSLEIPGLVELVARERELLAIALVPESHYVASVVSAEVPARWHQEARRAQAVVSRTFSRQGRRRHQKDGFDVCDVSHCQVYQGQARVSNESIAAVNDTAEQILTHRSKPIQALFHSTCGGSTSRSTSVWRGPHVSYLVERADEHFCEASPYYQWTARMPRKKLHEIILTLVPESTETVRSLAVLRRDAAGRAIALVVNGRGPELSAYDFYLTWGRSRGWHQLKSTWFDIIEHPDEVVFVGRGLGHGVGLCQWGAQGRAQAGALYTEILAYYYPETVLTPAKI